MKGLFLLALAVTTAAGYSINYVDFQLGHTCTYNDYQDTRLGVNVFHLPKDILPDHTEFATLTAWTEEACATLCAESEYRVGFGKVCAAFSFPVLTDGKPAYSSYNKCNIYYDCVKNTQDNDGWTEQFHFRQVDLDKSGTTDSHPKTTTSTYLPNRCRPKPIFSDFSSYYTVSNYNLWADRCEYFTATEGECTAGSSEWPNGHGNRCTWYPESARSAHDIAAEAAEAAKAAEQAAIAASQQQAAEAAQQAETSQQQAAEAAQQAETSRQAAAEVAEAWPSAQAAADAATKYAQIAADHANDATNAMQEAQNAAQDAQAAGVSQEEVNVLLSTAESASQQVVDAMHMAQAAADAAAAAQGEADDAAAAAQAAADAAAAQAAADAAAAAEAQAAAACAAGTYYPALDGSNTLETIYSRDACEALPGGVYHANGVCTRSTGGSYSVDCRVDISSRTSSQSVAIQGQSYEYSRLSGHECDSVAPSFSWAINEEMAFCACSSSGATGISYNQRTAEDAVDKMTEQNKMVIPMVRTIGTKLNAIDPHIIQKGATNWAGEKVHGTWDNGDSGYWTGWGNIEACIQDCNGVQEYLPEIVQDTPSYAFHGCYEDTRDSAGDRAHFQHTDEEYQYTVLRCKERAETEGSKFFGLQATPGAPRAQCWWGPTPMFEDGSSLTKPVACYMQGSGNGGKHDNDSRLGGNLVNAIYEILK